MCFCGIKVKAGPNLPHCCCYITVVIHFFKLFFILMSSSITVLLIVSLCLCCITTLKSLPLRKLPCIVVCHVVHFKWFSCFFVLICLI